MKRGSAGVSHGARGNVLVNPTITGNATGVPKTLSQSGIPFIKLSSGSMGNNGAVTALTALPTTYTSGAWAWFPAGSVAAGVPASASWLWFVASSATAGTVYNSTYISGTPTIGTTTAFVTTGPGAFVGDTGDITGPSLTVAANSIGANGLLRYWTQFSFNNTAGAKTGKAKFGGTTWMTLTGANSFSIYDVREIRNLGLTNAQSGPNVIELPMNTTKAIATYAAIDTTASQTLTFTLTAAVATDHTILDGYTVQVQYAA